jgi:hypothetical protein
LEDDGVVWDDNDAMLKHAMNYKTLFGEEPKVNIRLGEAFWSEDEMVKIEENKALEADFSEEEIKKAVFDSYVERDPGTDGMSFLFYQKFWHIIKGGLMALITGFEMNEVKSLGSIMP